MKMTENDFHFVWAYIAAELCKGLHFSDRVNAYIVVVADCFVIAYIYDKKNPVKFTTLLP